MTTLIDQGRGNTRYVRRCDAKCHNAKGKKCYCVCEGALHGKGSQGAAAELKRLIALDPNPRPGMILIATPQRELEFKEVKT